MLPRADVHGLFVGGRDDKTDGRNCGLVSTGVSHFPIVRLGVVHQDTLVSFVYCDLGQKNEGCYSAVINMDYIFFCDLIAI